MENSFTVDKNHRWILFNWWDDMDLSPDVLGASVAVSYRSVNQLPLVGAENTIYCLPNNEAYIYLNGEFLGIGSAPVRRRDPKNIQPYITYTEKPNETAISQPSQGQRLMNIDLTNLARLADTRLNAEMAQFGVKGMIPEQFREALARVQEEEARMLTDQAAKSVLALYKQSEDHVMNLVGELRQLRRAEQRVLALLNQMNRAKAYGAATGNFLPLAVMMGITPPVGVNKDLLVVPDTWVEAKSEEPQSQAKASTTARKPRRNKAQAAK